MVHWIMCMLNIRAILQLQMKLHAAWQSTRTHYKCENENKHENLGVLT